jgi:hypothetical protein
MSKASQERHTKCGHKRPRAISKLGSNAQGVAESGQNVRPQLRHRPRHKPALMQIQAQTQSGLDCPKRHRERRKEARPQLRRRPTCGQAQMQIQGATWECPKPRRERPKSEATTVTPTKACAGTDADPRRNSNTDSNAQRAAERATKMCGHHCNTDQGISQR